MDERIERQILELCKTQDWHWEEHIRSVAKFSFILAEGTGANVEVCELAAWLHDIAKLQGKSSKVHHIDGAHEAERILRELKYPHETIEAVKHCILTHSSDQTYQPESDEAMIVASADALAFFENFLSFVSLALVDKRMDNAQAREWLTKKVETSWDKMMPEARALAQQRYDAILNVLREGMG